MSGAPLNQPKHAISRTGKKKRKSRQDTEFARTPLKTAVRRKKRNNLHRLGKNAKAPMFKRLPDPTPREAALMNTPNLSGVLVWNEFDRLEDAELMLLRMKKDLASRQQLYGEER